MLKLTALTFAVVAALSFGAGAANASSFDSNRAPQPTDASGQHCQGGIILHGHCQFPGPGPQLGGLPCNGHRPCPTPVDPATDCAGGSQTIYGTTHECP